VTTEQLSPPSLSRTLFPGGHSAAVCNIRCQESAVVAGPSSPGGPCGAQRPGPGSLTWRCVRDSRGFLLAAPTLILQVAHPVVGAGVTQYSSFLADPWTRLLRTIVSVNRVVFAPAAAAAAESQRLRRLHAAIRGTDHAGRPYHALDPAAYAWVHLTLVHFFVEVQRVFGQPLTAEQHQQLYREWRRRYPTR
jgi:uncharacterized protein (DUF2236 family)